MPTPRHGARTTSAGNVRAAARQGSTSGQQTAGTRPTGESGATRAGRAPGGGPAGATPGPRGPFTPNKTRRVPKLAAPTPGKGAGVEIAPNKSSQGLCDEVAHTTQTPMHKQCHGRKIRLPHEISHGHPIDKQVSDRIAKILQGQALEN
jgi:hypothetical protein